jgi:ABC-type transport system involved in multi-copper enzyme maturation permease subunit
VNTTIFLITLRQRFTSLPRVALALSVLIFPVGFAMLAAEAALQATRTGGMFAFILGAGILGQETSSGVYQLLFARPVRRWEYVTSRWLAVCAASCALVLLQVLGVCLVLASKGLPGTESILTMVAEQMLSAVGTASVILFYSSLLPGVVDVVGILLTLISAQVLGGLAHFLEEGDWVVRASAEITRFLGPQLPLGAAWSAGVPWFDLFSYLSTVSLCLAVAVWMMNRREISYATE